MLFGIIYLMPIFTANTSLAYLISSPNALSNYLTRIGKDPLLAKFGRFTDLKVTLELLGGSTFSFLFGFGPGLISKSGQSIATSSNLFWYLNKGIGGYQATSVLLETGVLGFVCILLQLLAVTVGIVKVPQRTKNSTKKLRIIAFIVVIPIYVIAIFYTQPWWSPAISVTFWTFAGMTWTNARKRDLGLV